VKFIITISSKLGGIMKNRLVLLLMIYFLFFTYLQSVAQEETEKAPASVEELSGKVDGIDENVTTLLTDVAGLKKLKITGYFQFQFEKTELAKGFDAKAVSPYDASDFIQARFRVRRGRVKVTYDAGLTQFVFQGDFTPAGFALKDFFLNITDPWTKMFDLTVGQFNRPTYEVEYSSSVREAPERSLITRTLYPNERDLGAMISFSPEGLFKLQLATFNNTFLSDVAQNNPNFRDDNLYYMARITKELSVMEGLSIDLGAHGRFGNVRSNSQMLIPSDVPTNAPNSNLDSSASNYGLKLSKNWFGGEIQLYWDAPVIGGTKLLAEYITGSSVDELPASSTTITSRKIRKRDFAGFYVMLVKNIFTEWQFALRYDQYNPNTKIDIAKVNNINDLTQTTIGLGIHNYTFENVRITLWYDMPKYKTTSGDNKLMTESPKQNQMTLRLQYKF
jgi:hypothetical protein